jgi:mannose-6-phosphate isomerase-like protein (cupin superfamily)
MQPYEDEAPELSWANCAARHTPQLHEGVLWKCAPLAYLGQQHRKFGLSDKWAPYLQYRPLTPDCSDEELADFLARGAESYCGMCPARPENFELPLPLPRRQAAQTQSPAPANPASPRASVQPSEPPLRLASTTRVLPTPLPEDPRTGWRPYPILRGRMANAAAFGCHASVLSAGVMPHTPHQHPEEELLIILDGEADLVIKPGTEPAKRFRARPGVLVYYPAFAAHTIHNVGRAPVRYLMMKWQSDPGTGGRVLGTHIAQYPFPSDDPGKAPRRSFMTRPLLEGPTGYLEKLHCHLTVLQPGAGYPPHADSYDIAIVLLSGAVETLGRRVGPHGVIHYAAGEPHGMRSLGPGPAVYLVFEFHGRRAADVVGHLAPEAPAARGPRPPGAGTDGGAAFTAPGSSAGLPAQGANSRTDDITARAAKRASSAATT